jgi:hypothetical protein
MRNSWKWGESIHNSITENFSKIQKLPEPSRSFNLPNVNEFAFIGSFSTLKSYFEKDSGSFSFFRMFLAYLFKK